jgi:iron complex outermembrane recepter protein
MKIIFTLFFVFFLFTITAAQRINGRVYDNQTSSFIIGAEVSIETSQSRAVTNSAGRYSLKAPSGEHRVRVSAPGFTTQYAIITVGVVDYTFNVAMRKTSDLTKDEVEVGSRDIGSHTYIDTPVAIDNIRIEQFANAFGQLDLSQLLHFLLPSFNSNHQSGSDGSDHVDPSILRGLGQDQVLVLVNGKRRHQASLVYLFGSTGRGNTPTDLNTIPLAAIERVEILRDGASAQYGSDAIAGVINIVLKQSTDGVKLNANHGIYQVGDGLTQNYNLNVGKPLANDGYLNITADYLQRNRLYRSADAVVYPDVPRQKFGDTNAKNYSLYYNTEAPTNWKKNAFIYSFGGIHLRNTDAHSWTYEANNERNIKSVYPEGFEPRILSNIIDGTASVGFRTANSGAWNVDINNIFSKNYMAYTVTNTLNASLGAKTPTSFDAGGFSLGQNVTGLYVSRKFRNGIKNTNVALGSEFRIENYSIFAGEDASWKKYPNTADLPGGAQTFPGLRPENEVDAYRTNLSAFAEIETDLSQAFLVTAAARFEHYNDFGNTLNGKLAFRFRLSNDASIRGSASTGFRAPSLAQTHFSAVYNDVVNGQSFEKLLAINNGSVTNALGISPLKQEKSINYSLGTVLKSSSKFNLTVDGYFVEVRDRVVLTGDFNDSDKVIGATLKKINVKSALFFTNALGTRSYGVDVVSTVFSELSPKSKLESMISFNYNKISILELNTANALVGKEDNYFSGRDRSFVLMAAPVYKFNASFVYIRPKFNINGRFVGFSGVSIGSHEQNNSGQFVLNHYQARIIADASIGFQVVPKARLILGCSNIFNTYPTRQNPAFTETGGMYEAVQMGFGGRFFFTKIKVDLQGKN